MSATPCVSVVMPAYNAERYLREAVESILAQSFDDFEFIIVDDGSTDGTLAMLRSFAESDARLRIISRPNTGIVGALNDGLAAGKGLYLARMDADDIALPTRFARQVEYMQRHPEVVAAGTSAELIDPDGESLGVPRLPATHDEIDDWHLGGQGAGIYHPTLMARRSAIEQIGGYRQAYQWVEDYDLLLRLAEVGQLGNCPDVLLRYRLHLANVCHERAGVQAKLIEEALHEALARRGMQRDRTQPAPRDDAPNDPKPPSRHTMLARTALDHDKLQAAHKHAWLGVRHAPWSLWSWQVLVDVHDALTSTPGQDDAPSPSRLSRFAARAVCEILQAPRNVKRLVRWTCSHTPGLWRLVHQR